LQVFLTDKRNSQI